MRSNADLAVGRDGGDGVLEHDLAGLIVAFQVDDELVEGIDAAGEFEGIGNSNALFGQSGG